MVKDRPVETNAPPATLAELPVKRQLLSTTIGTTVLSSSNTIASAPPDVCEKHYENSHSSILAKPDSVAKPPDEDELACEKTNPRKYAA